MIDLPDVVREKAVAVGASAWIDDLPELISTFEAEWGITVGRAYRDSTEALVAEAVYDDGTEAVLKLIVPRGEDAAAHEATVLRLADGKGCPRLL
jgi:streptomycin 6-kinase